MLFAYSWKDAFLVLLSLLNLSLLVAGLFVFDRLPVPALVLLGGGLVFLNCTNYQCVAHNFLHNPFFRSSWLNNVFSVLNSVSLGLPQTLYKYHHLNHHQHNNDVLNPDTKTTQDRSSTFRFAQRPPKEEHILTYSLLGPFRTELAPLYTTARSKRRGTIVWFEAAAMLAFTAGLTIASPFYVLQFVLPVWFLGQAAALAENYLEHHHAIPGHRLTDSVSCYNTLYNLIWFNNGYHQEHHYRPTVHWTEVPPLRGEMLPETDRRVVKGAHWFNFGSVRKAADKPVLQAIPDEAQRR